MKTDTHASKITIYIPLSDLITRKRLAEEARQNDHTISKQIYLLLRDHFREEPDASQTSSQH